MTPFEPGVSFAVETEIALYMGNKCSEETLCSFGN